MGVGQVGARSDHCTPPPHSPTDRLDPPVHFVNHRPVKKYQKRCSMTKLGGGGLSLLAYRLVPQHGPTTLAAPDWRTGCSITLVAQTADALLPVSARLSDAAHVCYSGRESERGPWRQPLRTSSNHTSYQVTGLLPYTVYSFRLTAVNGVGAGQPGAASYPVHTLREREYIVSR